MSKSYRVLLGATLAVALSTPLWLDGGVSAERALAQRLESLVLPTAVAAVLAPTTTTSVTRDVADQVDAAGLLMAGTTLLGLAAVVRKVV